MNLFRFNWTYVIFFGRRISAFLLRLCGAELVGSNWSVQVGISRADKKGSDSRGVHFNVSLLENEVVTETFPCVCSKGSQSVDDMLALAAANPGTQFHAFGIGGFHVGLPAIVLNGQQKI